MRASDLIVDIGSGSVGIAFLETGKEKPILSGTIRTPLALPSEEQKGDLPRLSLEALKKTLEAAKAQHPPKHVQVVLASPWYDAKIRTIVSQSEKQVRVTADTITRSIQDYLEKKNENSLQPGRERIESVVSQAYVNGYPTALKKPILGTGLKINYYAAEADQAFLSGISELIKNAFPHASIAFHSFGLIACLILRTIRKEDNFVMLDVGGEITDVIIAHHDGLRYVGTFPVGTRSIIRGLAGTGSVADTMSRLALYAKDELSNEEAAAFRENFEKVSAQWGSGFQALLEDAVKEVAVPQTTFLFADTQELSWLPTVIEGTRGVFSSRVTPILPSVSQNLVEVSEGASYDPFLCFESLYFHSRKDVLIELTNQTKK